MVSRSGLMTPLAGRFSNVGSGTNEQGRARPRAWYGLYPQLSRGPSDPRSLPLRIGSVEHSARIKANYS
jgi:hypothetical protein